MSESSAIKSLYPEELYSIPAAPVVVVVSKPWGEISESERTTLSRMLVAVRLNLASIHIVTKKEFSLMELSAFAPGKVLVFGAALQSFSKLYEHQVIDGTSVIVSEALDKLDDAKKKTLWLALKQMFGL